MIVRSMTCVCICVCVYVCVLVCVRECVCERVTVEIQIHEHSAILSLWDFFLLAFFVRCVILHMHIFIEVMEMNTVTLFQ